MYNPSHPGLILKEYIDGMKITDIAKRLGVSRVALSRVINGKAAISPEMALRLSQLLPNTSADFWLKMQAAYDLWQAEQHLHISIEPLVLV